MAFFDYDLKERLKQYDFGDYFRRSSEDNEDKQVRSIEGQQEDIAELIEKLGLPNVYHYPPESKSAFKKGRPIFNQIMKDIEKGIINALIVWHANRISRNYGDGGDFVQLMAEGKLKIVLTPFGVFENTPRDMEYLMNEFTRATRDSGDKSDAVKRGNRTKLKAGYIPSGRLKEGYIHGKNERDEMINTSDPDRFHLLRQGIELILNGTHKPKEALAVLNNEWKYKTRKTKRTGGKELSKSAWYSLLNDRKYCGKIVRSEGKFDAEYPKLMEPEEFDKIQILLGRRANRYRTPKDWAYTGEVICQTCEGYITMEDKWQIICSSCKTKFHVAKDRFSCPNCDIDIEDMDDPTVLYYEYLRCGKSKKMKDGKRCSQHAVAVLNFESQVDRLLEQITIPEKFTKWAITWLRKLHKEEVKERTAIKKNLQIVDNDIQKQLDTLLNLRLRGSISNEEYDEKKAALQNEQKDVRTGVQKTDKRADDWLELCEKTYNFATYARIWFQKGTSEQKRAILHALGSNLILDDKILLIQQRKPFTIIAKNRENIQIVMDTFEPEELLDLTSQTPDVHPLIPSLLPDMDSDHDERIQSPLSYH